ncbi:hypothetical protein C1N53_04705 [Pontibacter sp. SGAir0037]|nr:hypothetical protein C1N53_04705 [Pontibacter sp. SGAir0037]
MLKNGLALFLLVVALSSCRKEPNFPDEPHIQYLRVEQSRAPLEQGQDPRIARDIISIVIRFQDGDGNLGLSSTIKEDTEAPFNFGSPYYNNFIANLLIREQDPNGGYRFVPYPFPELSSEFNQRFPRVSNDDRKEPLEGELKYTTEAFDSDIFAPGTVVKFELFIYDRTTPVPHKSNVIVTDEITLFPDLI